MPSTAATAAAATTHALQSGALATRALNAEGGAPDWIEAIPAGPDILGRDGRRFRCADPYAVVEASNPADAPIPVDVEHATEVRAPQGLDAPAYGWVEGFEVRDGGSIWAHVDWTRRGRGHVEDREYRFISPVFEHDREGCVIRITSLALTNNPNLRLTALNQRGAGGDDTPNPDPTPPETGASTVDAKALREALGLPADATDDAVLTAAKTQRSANSAGPDLTKYAPRTELDAAARRIQELEAAAAERHKGELEKSADDAVDAALGEGKITPAAAPEYRALCRKDGGLETFKRLMATSPRIVGESDGKALNRVDPAAAGGGAAGLSEVDRSVARAMGLSDEDFAKGKA